MEPVRFEQVSKSYRGKKREKIRALTDLTLTVDSGEVLGLLGPNGAGKSTTIKILTGQLRPDTGSVAIFGRSVDDLRSRRVFGYLPENPSFYTFLTGREYLRFVGESFGLAGDEIRRETGRVLAILALEDAADRPIRGYSKGMVQRLGLAQALLHDPDLFIFDEPMSGLDPLGRALVKELMAELKGRGKTILFSTHVTADIEAVCDRVAILVQGNLNSLRSVREVVHAGIESYEVQLTGCPQGEGEPFSLAGEPRGEQRAIVAKEHLPEFLAYAAKQGATIHLIEPKRRNLEKFFLEIVGKGE